MISGTRESALVSVRFTLHLSFSIFHFAFRSFSLRSLYTHFTIARCPRRSTRSIFPSMTTRSALVVTILLLAALPISGGRPGPPQRHPPERRQANMLVLRFQDALAAERWQEALACCSEGLRTSASERPTPKDFFNDTLPIEHVLAQDFACWSCGTNFYGLFVTLSSPGVEPRVDWFWGLMPTPGGWVVDYPPVKLADYIVNRKRALQQRDERIDSIRRALEPQVRNVATRLTAVSERFTIGSPMLFRVELVNSGATPVHYMDTGVRHNALTVLNAKREPVPALPDPLQIQINKAELPAGASVMLGEKIDINKGRNINQPGKYSVQFDSPDVQVGQPVPSEEMGRFGETLPLTVFDFLSATNRFPSNILEIEVRP
jgi:hypothetical protein